MRELNAGFTRARDVSHIVVAYHEAAEVVAFLIRRLGFEKCRRRCGNLPQGKETTEVLPAVTGLDLAASTPRSAPICARGCKPPTRGTSSCGRPTSPIVDALKDRIAAHPDDARAKGLLRWR